MILPFTDSLIVSHKFDCELAALADRHYSRQTVGSPQFLPPGRTIAIRNSEGTLVFGWVWQFPEYRDDGEQGFNCSIFRNESGRRSSEVILECEQIAIDKWGRERMFTYIDPREITIVKKRGAPQPGFCFLRDGWKFVRQTKDGKHLLEKVAA